MPRTGETSRFGRGDVRRYEPGTSEFVETAIRQASGVRPLSSPPLPDGYIDSQRAAEIMHRAPPRNRTPAQQEELEIRAMESARHDLAAAEVLQENRGRLGGVLWANLELGKMGAQPDGHPLHAELAAQLATLAIHEWGITPDVFPKNLIEVRRITEAWTGVDDARRAYQDRQGAA